MQTTKKLTPFRHATTCLSALLVSLPIGSAWAQQNAPATSDEKEEEVVMLSPFEVSATEDRGYTASTTLAGNRLNTDVRDIGNAVTVITAKFLKDIGATDNQTLLQYTTNTEVGNVFGNFVGAGDGSLVDESTHFTNPNSNTRVRGLTSADNTRDYFLTDIPWEGYNVDGVDLQRGPNSILFGQGSPAGIINTRTKTAGFKDRNEVSFRVGSWGSNRTTLDINRVLLKNELAIRLAAVRNDEKYQQDPAYSLQKRLFGATRWEPAFLKKGDARTIIKANIEFGDIKSNNPRQLPPLDQITPWFATGTFQGRNVANLPATFNNLNKLTVIPSQNEDDNTGLPNHGFNRPAHNGPTGNYTGHYIDKYSNLTGSISGIPSEYYQPWIGRSFGGQFGNPAFNFSGNDATQGTGYYWEPTSYHGMDATGNNRTRTTGIALPFQRPAGVSNYADFAQNARLPFASSGVYRNKSLTDPSIFDFYNNLLDGPTKREWQNFRTYNVSLAQTFFRDRVGFEASYNREWYKSGNVRLLSGDQQSLTIDMNSVFSDGTPAGKNGEPYGDGTPNTNVGRAVVSDTGAFGNNSYVSNRESGRVTVFADYDFNETHRNWFTRFLGRHIVTGLLAGDRQETDNRSWARYSVQDDTYELLVNNRLPSDPAYLPLSFMAAQMLPYSYVYLGPSLKDKSSASGANIPAITVDPLITSGKVRVFDATWKATGVNPGDYWHNDYYPQMNPVASDGLYRDGNGAVLSQPNRPGDSTQSENPANYVGWRDQSINIIDSENTPGGRDLNTHDARLTKSKVFSRAFTWQGHFWDNAIVGTFGVRKDIAKSWQYSVNTTNNGIPANNYRLDLNPSKYHLKDNPDNSLEVTSHAWTVVAHLNQLPWLNKVKLPLQVSLFYNKSTDFQPAAQRVDIYGVPLAAPAGKTKDVGILLESNDGKYSLKVNKYTTNSVGATSSALQYDWFIGSSQAWAANWANRFEFNWTADNNAGAVPVNDPNNSEYNYAPGPGETLAQAQAREASVVAAWRAWQKSVDPRFYAAWGINLNDPTKAVTATRPNGLSVTEDSVSEGYEIELSATPTPNWRVSLNASKAKAQRTNIGGTNLRAFVDSYVKALSNGKPGTAGDLRIWWGAAGNETTLQEWYSGNQPFGSVYAQRSLQSGTDVPELREWRCNAITNYEFDQGWMKGISVGGGFRYESPIVIGYKPIYKDASLKDATGAADDSPANTTYDLANPYKGPRELNFDLWLGYHRKIWRKYDWSVQLNVRNVGVGNELIPVTTEPDGTGATYRIKPPQVIQLTNTLNF